MKWLYNILVIVCGIFAFLEQSKPEPNVFIIIICMFVFGAGLYRLMKKIPNKEEENNEE